jgi:hypothetical protein
MAMSAVDRTTVGVLGVIVGATLMMFVCPWRHTPPAPVAPAPMLSEDATPRDHYRGLPPPEFRGEWVGTVRFVDDVSKFCSDSAYACLSVQLGQIIMPNPCTSDKVAEVGWSGRSGFLMMLRRGSPWDEENYRTTMCHEIGHAHGWPGNHWIAAESEIAQIERDMIELLYEDDQVQGGMPEESLLRWRSFGKAGEAAIARLDARGDVDRRNTQTGPVIRLSRCKYWKMRQEREGDGEEQLSAWGCGQWLNGDPNTMPEHPH